MKPLEADEDQHARKQPETRCLLRSPTQQRSPSFYEREQGLCEPGEDKTELTTIVYENVFYVCAFRSAKIAFFNTSRE